MTDNQLNWSGFYKKTIAERYQLLASGNLLTPDTFQSLQNEELLHIETANQMSENVISRLALPFSIVPDFKVNGKTYHLPYVTEEPSVVAAASYAAKLIGRAGGFQAHIQNRQMIGQVALYDVPNLESAQAAIMHETECLIEKANLAYPSIVKRGGGARRISLTIKDQFLIVYLTVDTQEAMGANMVNTMMEALVDDLIDLSKGKPLMAILSNYATESLVTATCQVPFHYLSRDKVEAKELANKMGLASQLAQVDPYRAATHNKGIFNGIDAIVLATGNDWRAIESGAHAYASKDGLYKGLTTWHADFETEMIKGTITIPMPIATKGGSIGLNPSVVIAHDLLNQPTAKELSMIIASVGLAQNFAAIKALTNKGIQAGHMKLHAKSLAMLAGASSAETPQLLQLLLKEKHMNLETTKVLLQSLRNKKI